MTDKTDKPGQDAAKKSAARQAKHRRKRRLQGFERLDLLVDPQTKARLDALSSHWNASRRGVLAMLAASACSELDITV